MTLKNKPLVITLASGKGGVGKTSLAANLSYVLSYCGKTMLVDLDLQNQGCTSLFRNHEFPENSSMCDILTNRDTVRNDFRSVAKNLFFIPAVSLRLPPSQSVLYSIITSVESVQKISIFLDELKKRWDFEYIVIDCHGGMDFLSSVVFYYADRCYIVTEPDPVTFNGTLELLRTYSGAEERINAASNKGAVDAEHQIRNGRVNMIVNRLGGKLSFSSLEELYRPYFRNDVTDDDVKVTGIHYVPQEELLRDSFGDYPFYVELVPTSIFSRKVNYLAYCAVEMEGGEKPGRLKPYLSKRIRSKISRVVRSKEYVASVRLMNLAVAGLFFLLVAVFFLVTTEFLAAGSGSMAPVVLGYMAGLALYAVPTLKSMLDVYRGRWRYEIGIARKGMMGMGGVREMRIALLSVLIGVLSLGVTLAPLVCVAFVMGALLELGVLR